jgi:hypothetical protein
MAGKKKTTTASPIPVPGPSKSRVPLTTAAQALYAWAGLNQAPGYVFTQEELISSGTIPGNYDGFLPVSEAIVAHKLFRLHDRQGGSLGWELLAADHAKK